MTKLDAGLITPLPASDSGSAAVWGSKRTSTRPQFCLCLTWSGCPSNNNDSNILPWPARSPDVNPIENAWGWLTHQVYKNGKQYDTVADLKTAILKAWEEIPGEYLHKLISSMKNRIFEVINRNARKTHY